MIPSSQSGDSAAHSASESEIQQRILGAIGSRPEIRLFRANAGQLFHVEHPCPDCRARGRWIAGFPKGAPDLIGWRAPHGQFLGVEVKSERGRATEEQLAFGAAIEKRGGIYVVARSVADVEGVL